MAARGIFAVALALGAMFLPGAGVDASAASVAAAPTSSRVVVDGAETAFDAYNVKDSNYFKLRDLAFQLSGTEKQFDVGWDANARAVTLTSGLPYTVAGGEMAAKGGENKTPIPSSHTIIIDGVTVSLTAYNIDGNNYFMLRDIGRAFDFATDYDAATRTVVIDTGKPYSD